jgi:ABC-type bacteriocin/lantibiotic exporter with double-glycine peptidase domain
MAQDIVSDNKLSPVQRFFRMLAPDKQDIIYIYIYSIFSGLINLTLPVGIQAIISLILAGQVSTSWGVLATLVTIGVAVVGGLKIMQLIISESLQQRIFTRSAFEFAYRIPKFKMESIFKTYAPELVNRFFDTLTVQKGLPKILMDLSAAALQIIFGLILISFYNSAFLAFGLGLIFILFLIFWFTGQRGLETSLKESKYKYQVAHWLEEVARTMHSFKLAGTSKLHLEKVNELTENYLEARKEHFRILLSQFISIASFKTIITGGLLILGSILVINGEINIGQFVAAEIVIIQIMNASEKLILSMETVYDTLTALEKIGVITDIPLEDEKGLDFAEVNHVNQGLKIKASNLSYAFEGAHEPLLKNIDFEIQMGEKVCIAGFNGSGKSTLLNIIAGLYEKFDGALTYNDIPRDNLNISSLRYFIGNYSLQDDLFDGTLLENITMGDKSLNLQDVTWAIKEVGLQDFLDTQPKGFNTVIEPTGGLMSRTIIKKIVLARGIVHRPRLLAMEELLAKFERKERENIINFLTDKSQPWTLVVVSNDPNLASKCDRVFVMQDGKIVNQGSYDDVKVHTCFQKTF